MDDHSLFNTTAGLLTDGILKIPNRRFMPDCLFQTVVSGKNLHVLGCLQPEIKGSSIAFRQEQSLKGALGEFVERYASGIYDHHTFTIGSYSHLQGKKNALDPAMLRFYSDEQYERLKALNVYPLDKDDCIEWTEGFDLIEQKPCLLPAFCVYMPYQSHVNSPHDYMLGATSTGIAAGPDIEKAIINGFLECAERHAFSQFWYLQKQQPLHSYTAGFLLKNLHASKTIRRLFDNPNVHLKVFDLSEFSALETTVTFLYFNYKGKDIQSLGCAARFHKKEAIVKSTIEAYQGIEYAISLFDKKQWPSTPNTDLLCDFDSHFHFYNSYPEYRAFSPVLKDAALSEQGNDQWYQKDPEKQCRDFSPEELKKTGLKHLYYKDITPIDIEDISYKVARVITPSWSLLTGLHAWPFLGGQLNTARNLFTEYPHPFP